MANQHEHSTRVSHPIYCSFVLSLQQSPSQKCLPEKITIRNVRVLKSSLLPSSIYLQSPLPSYFSSFLFSQQSSIKFTKKDIRNLDNCFPFHLFCTFFISLSRLDDTCWHHLALDLVIILYVDSSMKSALTASKRLPSSIT